MGKSYRMQRRDLYPDLREQVGALVAEMKARAARGETLTPAMAEIVRQVDDVKRLVPKPERGGS